MVRVAGERISTLFALAEREASAGAPNLADRYVALARKIGMRYNVRLLPEYRELYCRGCSRFWVEGRTVRTRLRAGRRVRTCLLCGRERRVLIRPASRRGLGKSWDAPTKVARDEGALATPLPGVDEEEGPEEESEEE
jgi:ribonuclease P protein subunit RPR2